MNQELTFLLIESVKGAESFWQ